MARDRKRERDDSTPGEMPVSTPESILRPNDMHVLQLLSEIQHDIGRLAEKVDGINSRLDKTDTKVSKFNDTVTFLKGGALIGGTVLVGAIGLFWWILGDKIGDVIKGPKGSGQQYTQPAAPLPSQPR